MRIVAILIVLVFVILGILLLRNRAKIKAEEARIRAAWFPARPSPISTQAKPTPAPIKPNPVDAPPAPGVDSAKGDRVP